MKNLKFERELNSLIYYVREYGIHRVNINEDDIKKNKDNRHAFISSVHKGFNLAQQNVIACLRKILLEQKQVKLNIKKANVEKSKSDKAKLNEQLHKLKYQEHVLRRIIDSIAWQMLQYDLTSIRRLYHSHSLIDITDSNIESCIRASEKIANDNPLHFALINDISSFIQVGDLTLCKYGESISFIELKEGIVNEKVYKVLDSFVENKCERFLYYSLLNEGDKFKEQFMRNIKQIKSSNDTIHSINTGEGFSPHYGVNVTTFQGTLELDNFEAEMIELINICKKKNYAISVIEGCLLVGVYNTQKFPSNVFDYWVKDLEIETPIYDLRQNFFDPFAYPIFLHNFHTKDLIDIVSGRMVIKMTIDIKAWLSTFEKEGYEYRWMTAKETARSNSKANRNAKIFTINKRGIEIKKGAFSVALGGGLFIRMFTRFNTPSSIKQYLIETGKHIAANENNNIGN